MFSVIFEVHPRTGQRDAYLGSAEVLRPELEQVPGFVDNIRYRSLTREGWFLSLSSWRDEKSVVRWRTRARHHEAQEKGRAAILEDYHLRVGELSFDTQVPDGRALPQQRFDETEIGEGTAITLIDARQSADWVASHNPQEIALYLGFDLNSYGDCVSWDVFQGIVDPGDLVLLVSWKDHHPAMDFAQTALVPDDSRVRAVRVVRDYGMFDRREAPQYYPDAPGRDSIHA